jgi:hypothetical protein
MIFSTPMKLKPLNRTDVVNVLFRASAVAAPLIPRREGTHMRPPNLYVVGGAGLVLSGLRETTSDIDFAISNTRIGAHLLEAQDTIARTLGLVDTAEPPAQAYPSLLDDRVANRLSYFMRNRGNHFEPFADIAKAPAAGLSVHIARAEPQLALKLSCWHAREKEIRDISALAERLAIHDAVDLQEFWQRQRSFIPASFRDHVNPDYLRRRWAAVETYRRESDAAAFHAAAPIRPPQPRTVFQPEVPHRA